MNNHSALHLYGEDGTWKMLGYKITNEISDDGKARQITKFSFYLERRQIFYLVSFIGPVILLSMTACLVFVIPADAGEKMGTSITVLLAFAVYLTIVTDYLPDTSLQVSYLALYLTVLLGTCALSVILTTFILHIYHYPEDHPVGPKVTWLTNFLQTITCFSRKAESQQQHARDIEEILDKLDTIGDDIPDTNSDEHHVRLGSKDSRYSATKPVVDTLNWQIVSKTFDWFFYLVFSLVVIGITIVYLAMSYYEGVVLLDSYNDTGTLLPTFGRRNTGLGLVGELDDS